MRFSCFIACLLVGIYDAEKAIGISKQNLFADNMTGIWWVLAFFWVFTAFRVLLHGAE